MNVLCVFTRLPTPGVNKSRLRRELGDADVDALVSALFDDVLHWDTPEVQRVLLAYQGGDSVTLPSHCFAIAQQGDDFGARLAHALDSCFEHGATRAVIVGTDSPNLPADMLSRAFTELDEHHATLLPVRDGGWAALGVREPLGDALAEVRWSSEHTCADTITALERDGRAPLLLPPWYDVDELDDLLLLSAALESPQQVARAPRTAAALRSLRLPAR